MPVSWLPRPMADPRPPRALLLLPGAAAPLLPLSLLLVAPDAAPAAVRRGLLKPSVRVLLPGLLPGGLLPAPQALPRDSPGPLQLTALTAGPTPAGATAVAEEGGVLRGVSAIDSECP
jgi:hypothetical protein